LNTTPPPPTTTNKDENENQNKDQNLNSNPTEIKEAKQHIKIKLNGQEVVDKVISTTDFDNLVHASLQLAEMETEKKSVSKDDSNSNSNSTSTSTTANSTDQNEKTNQVIAMSQVLSNTPVELRISSDKSLFTITTNEDAEKNDQEKKSEENEMENEMEKEIIKALELNSNSKKEFFEERKREDFNLRSKKTNELLTEVDDPEKYLSMPKKPEESLENEPTCCRCGLLTLKSKRRIGGSPACEKCYRKYLSEKKS